MLVLLSRPAFLLGFARFTLLASYTTK
jgi:hypothetical protein